jgi:uncharacterized protein
MTSESYHERHEDLSEGSRDLHRALTSLMEELEAVDWYQQRVDATSDPALKEILAHNRDEEIEHAAMVLEWLRRRNATFDEQLRRYLFTTEPIVAAEEAAATAPADSPADSTGTAQARDKHDPQTDAGPAAIGERARQYGSLGIGSLKGDRRG